MSNTPIHKDDPTFSLKGIGSNGLAEDPALGFAEDLAASEMDLKKRRNLLREGHASALADHELLSAVLVQGGEDPLLAQRQAVRCIKNFGGIGATLAAPYRAMLETLHGDRPGFQCCSAS